MIKFFNKFKKTCFWPIFGPFSQFLGQNFFSPENRDLSHTASCGFLAPCQNLEKTKDKIPRKCPDGRTEGQKDRQTLFHSTFPATAVDLKNLMHILVKIRSYKILNKIFLRQYFLVSLCQELANIGKISYFLKVTSITK